VPLQFESEEVNFASQIRPSGRGRDASRENMGMKHNSVFLFYFNGMKNGLSCGHLSDIPASVAICEQWDWWVG
jgi:hypothetical protein